jgi:outer membrane protein
VKEGLIVCLTLLFAVPLGAQEKIKVGFIDIQKAIVESQAGKKAKENFQTHVKKAEADLIKEKQEIERLKSDYDKKTPLLKDEERRSLEKEMERRYVVYQRNMQDSQNELRQRESEMTNVILRDLEKVVVEVGKKENFTLILERSQVLYSDQGIDITAKVIELYNSRTPTKATKGK